MKEHPASTMASERAARRRDAYNLVVLLVMCATSAVVLYGLSSLETRQPPESPEPHRMLSQGRRMGRRGHHHHRVENAIPASWAAKGGIATALLLAISSSTDNFAVGLSVALAGAELPLRVNVIIAVCNAVGALASAALGEAIGVVVPMLGPGAAAVIFIYLAKEEIDSYRAGEDMSPLASSAAQGLAWKLAPPMTLNNLAGGVASGVLGIAPSIALACALLASLVMMQGGYVLGGLLLRFGTSGSGSGGTCWRYVDPRVAAACIFGCVAIVQLRDTLDAVATASATSMFWASEHEHARRAA